ncbi:uncharacterized protein LOC120336493 [Styela clava]
MFNFNNLLLAFQLLVSLKSVHAGYEWRFYSSRVTWDGASASCQNMGFNLVNSDEALSALRSNLGRTSINELWIGLYELSRGGTWKWLGGSYAYGIPWEPGQPDNGGWPNFGGNEDYAIIRKKDGLIDDKLRNSKFGYVCQRKWWIGTTISIKQTSNSVVCQLSGYPTPDVLWYYRNHKITFTSSSRVYQSQGTGQSSLYLSNTNLLNEGVYNCIAKNTVGTRSGQAVVRVPSRPTILSRTSLPCESTLIIKWRSHPKAIGLRHKIILKISPRYIIVKEKYVYANGNVNIEFKDLIPSTFYRLEIFPCPLDCYSSYTAVSPGLKTKGLPGPVSNPSIDTYKGFCKVSWSFPLENQHSDIIGFKINVSSSLAKVPFFGYSIPSNTFEYLLDNYTNQTFQFPNIPNRKYYVTIQAKTCAGYGEFKVPDGECVTHTKAPEFIDQPTTNDSISDNGTLAINVKIPDEGNGPISCIFVVVRRTNISNVSATLYLKQRLINASVGDTVPESEYIALSLNRTRYFQNRTNYKSGNVTLTLGTKSLTTCYLHGDLKHRKNISNESYFDLPMKLRGYNMKLSTKKSYIIHIVSATPTTNRVLFQVSDGLLLEKEPDPPEQFPVFAILLLVIWIIVILVACGTIVSCVKRKKQEKNEEQQKNTISTISYSAKLNKSAIESCHGKLEPSERSDQKDNIYHSYEHIKDPDQSSTRKYEEIRGPGGASNRSYEFIESVTGVELKSVGAGDHPYDMITDIDKHLQ